MYYHSVLCKNTIQQNSVHPNHSEQIESFIMSRGHCLCRPQVAEDFQLRKPSGHSNHSHLQQLSTDCKQIPMPLQAMFLAIYSNAMKICLLSSLSPFIIWWNTTCPYITPFLPKMCCIAVTSHWQETKHFVKQLFCLWQFHFYYQHQSSAWKFTRKLG